MVVLFVLLVVLCFLCDNVLVVVSCVVVVGGSGFGLV